MFQYEVFEQQGVVIGGAVVVEAAQAGGRHPLAKWVPEHGGHVGDEVGEVVLFEIGEVAGMAFPGFVAEGLLPLQEGG